MTDFVIEPAASRSAAQDLWAAQPTLLLPNKAKLEEIPYRFSYRYLYGGSCRSHQRLDAGSQVGGDRSPLALRDASHLRETWSIAAGLPTFEIARTMGTSLEQLDKTYGHLMPDSAERAKAALDAHLASTAKAAEARCAR